MSKVFRRQQVLAAKLPSDGALEALAGDACPSISAEFGILGGIGVIAVEARRGEVL
jgi:hypothetical protein